MNLYVYKKVTGQNKLTEMFSDLKWGVFVPSLTFILVLLQPVFWLKLLTTIALGALVGILIYKDDWALSWLISQVKHVVHRLASYA